MLTQVAVCSAAPALWAPLADVLDTFFHKPQNRDDGAEEADLAPVSTTQNTGSVASTPSESNDGGDPSMTPTANDFGVVQLDLEGDPNCDYTTKVRIAGSEYNVIIDTGSAHFAVASSACRDCIIPRRDHYRPNEEEEIAVDSDPQLQDAQSPQSSIPASQHDPEPLNLIKEQHTGQKSSTRLLASTPASTSTTLNYAPKSTSFTRVPSQTASFPGLSTPKADTTPRSGSLIFPIGSIPPAYSVLKPSELSAVKLKVKADFDERRNTLKAMRASLLGHEREPVVTNEDSRPTPSRNKALNPSLQPTTGPEAAPVAAAASITSTYLHGTRVPVHERRLVAAPAENLYPLSSSREYGQTISVSYGIKSHSVGWSGVMTTDLLTMEMAKVEPTAAFTLQSTNSTSSYAPGMVMEKEAGVEFAAIMENNGFFSQECGAQHGIWGLAYRTLSVDRKPTLFDTLSASMKIPNGFALQLCGRTSNTTKSGNMFLGGYSMNHLAEPMQFVPLVKKDWYQVRLDGFKVMGETVKGMQNVNLPKTIVDSGTTNILMSHYNLQFLIQSLARSDVVRWSRVIPDEDINNFWFRNAVLRLPRSAFQISTAARSVEVVLSGVAIPIYTSSFLRIKPVSISQAPAGYVDFWWHGFASSTPPDAVEAEEASGGAVMPGSVGTILGETLFAGKVVYFERGQDGAGPEDPDFGRIGFGRGKNCFAPADHASVNVFASEGKVVALDGLGPVRVAATSDARATKKTGVENGSATQGSPSSTDPSQPRAASPPTIHFPGLSGPIRLMGSASHSFQGLGRGMGRRLACGLLVAGVAQLV
ncbi:Beta-secretase 2 [Mortierella alpina]|uniref:Beta-secretase 2 n=1 Tax=Mortierella alpina TaxID=64518 RepID=A0A9P6IYQ2_MORAP|nr:Beta-secretase 2 [Mortierella alpina]